MVRDRCLVIPFGLSTINETVRMSNERAAYEMKLNGYSGAQADAVVSVVSFNRAARLKRGLVALAAAWAIAVVCVFIPVAHFFLVPGFLALGAYFFYSRWVTRTKVTEANGTCPDCGSQQAFDIGGNWNPPHRVACNECQRSLVLEFADSNA
ncbi:MAG: hypothetical protein JSW51_06510 [Gemmatimonadota bacterium]|nr:MAG: hypothetical protein JSW51_06510 [Gemmatimonadota bacterium]